MTDVTFDTLKYVKQLTAADVPQKQAEAQALALHGALDATLAQQAKLAHDAQERNTSETDNKIERVLLKLDTRFEKIDARFEKQDAKIELLRKDMEAMENRLVTRLTKVMLAVVSVVSAVTVVVTRLLSAL